MLFSNVGTSPKNGRKIEGCHFKMTAYFEKYFPFRIKNSTFYRFRANLNSKVGKKWNSLLFTVQL